MNGLVYGAIPAAIDFRNSSTTYTTRQDGTPERGLRSVFLATFSHMEPYPPPEEASLYQNVPGACRRGLHEMTDENVQMKNGWRMCRECVRANRKRDYAKNQERRSEYVKQWRLENTEKTRVYARLAYVSLRADMEAAKAHPCLDCHGSFPPECMDFDHVRGEKLLDPSRARSLPQFMAEIEKCELICSNCHRIRTRRRSLAASPHATRDPSSYVEEAA